MIVVSPDRLPVGGTLVYRYADRAFDTKDRTVIGAGALQINSLQIELDESGMLLYAWGYCPFEGWTEARLETPKQHDVALIYEGDIPDPGTCVGITEAELLEVHFDRSKNVICIGDCTNKATGIRFAPGSTAVLKDGKIVALWLAFQV